MGGRGTSSGSGKNNGTPRGRGISAGSVGSFFTPQQQTVTAQQVTQPQQPVNPIQTPKNQTQNPTPVQASNWVPQGQFNYTPQQLANLNDQQATALLKAANNIDMPNHLKDRPDGTQELVYALGMNEPPTIMDSTQFSQFMKQNNIPRSQIMSRQVGSGTYNTTARSQNRLSDQQVAQMWLSDPYNYIGGKQGGQALGAGAYFDMNGGANTGYGSGSTTLYTGVLNPKTARVITTGSLHRKAQAWAASHPKANAELQKLAGKARTFGSAQDSLYAIMLGYNVIHGMGSYYNVIDRSAMVIKQ